MSTPLGADVSFQSEGKSFQREVGSLGRYANVSVHAPLLVSTGALHGHDIYLLGAEKSVGFVTAPFQLLAFVFCWIHFWPHSVTNDRTKLFADYVRLVDTTKGGRVCDTPKYMHGSRSAVHPGKFFPIHTGTGHNNGASNLETLPYPPDITHNARVLEN